MKEQVLLTVDAAINLTLGLLLILFPAQLPTWLGIPATDSPFYPSILGGVLAGIGVALLLERFRDSTRMTGLGLGGAIAINVCGAGVLVAWLVGPELDIPAHGRLLLWALALIIVGLSAVELTAQFVKRGSSHTKP